MVVIPHSLARRSGFMFIALLVSGVLSVAISIVIARTVGVTEFGVYSMVVSLQNIVILIAGFAMATTLAKYISEHLVRDAKEAARVAKTGLVVVLLFLTISCIVYVFLSDFLGNGLYDEPMVTDLIPYSSLVVISSVFFATSFGVAQGCQVIRQMGLMRTATPALSLGLITVLVLDAGVRGAFVGYFVSQTVASLTMLYWINKRALPFWRSKLSLGDRSVIRRLMGYAVPAVMSGFLVGPVVWIGNTELALTSGFQVLGYFAAAYVFYQSFLVVPQSIVIPLIPKVSELSIRAPSEVPRATVWTLRFATVAMFPLVVGIGMFAEPIVILLYGRSYSDAADIVLLMASASYFYALASILGATLAGLGRVWVGLGMNLMWAAMFLVGVFLLVPNYGGIGLGGAFALSYAGHVLTSSLVVDRVVRMNLRQSHRFMALACGLVAACNILVISGTVDGMLGRLAIFSASTLVVVWLGRSMVMAIFADLTGALGARRRT